MFAAGKEIFPGAKEMFCARKVLFCAGTEMFPRGSGMFPGAKRIRPGANSTRHDGRWVLLGPLYAPYLLRTYVGSESSGASGNRKETTMSRGADAPCSDESAVGDP